MKLKLLLLNLVVLVGCAQSHYPTKEPLHLISTQQDPSRLKLEQAFNTYVQRAFLEDKTEIGIIQFADGSSSKYWFRSHHMCTDMGGTWFSMSDGSKMYMPGWFCCEVQLPEKQMASLKELRAYIKDYGGKKP